MRPGGVVTVSKPMSLPKVKLGNWKEELLQDHVIALLLMIVIYAGAKIWMMT